MQLGLGVAMVGGGFLASVIGRGDGSYLNAAGIIGSIIGAIIALLVYNAVSGKKRVRS